MSDNGEINFSEERRKLWLAYQRRAVYAGRGLYLLGFLIAGLFIVMVFKKDIRLDWPSLSLLWIVVLILALPLLGKINLSKEGGGIDFVDSLGIIDRIAASEAKAEAARSESFEQTRAQIGALSLRVTELTAGLQKLSSSGSADGGADATSDDIATLEAQSADTAGSAPFHGTHADIPQTPEPHIELGPDSDVEPNLRAIRRLLRPPTVEDDPQKNRFGGYASNNTRTLTAKVDRSSLGRKWFSVSVRLQSSDGEPLTGKYAFFFLHDSFDPDTYRVPVPPGSQYVEFDTTSKGAFTVGVVADKGRTVLELDLASDAVAAPQLFREN